MALSDHVLKMFRCLPFWLSLWLILVITYALALHNNFHIKIADYSVYGIQLVGDAIIGIFGFLSYKKSKNKKLRKFLLIVFVSICVGLFANEVYNLLFNILGFKTTSTVVNELWLVPYTIFLMLQIFAWVWLLYSAKLRVEGAYKKWSIRICFYQAAALIIFSILFTTTFRSMLVEPLGFIQIINTTLEATLFVVLSISLAKSKRKSLSYLATGFLLLLAFNLSHRFSYMSGYYYKTFDIAWLISFIFIIFGLAYFLVEKNKKSDFHTYNSLHVVTSSVLMLFTSLLFVLFVSLEFFITTLEVNAIGQVKLLIENMPSVLIFSFTVSVIVSKIIAERASIPLKKVSERISLMQDGKLEVGAITSGNSNIHEVEQLDTFILKTLNHLQIANRAKSEFLMNMSHDFRTPASGICSMSKLLYKKTTDEKMKRLQKLVVGSSKQLLSLLDDVLEYSKLDSNTISLDREITNINNILNDIIVFVSAKAEEKGLTIKINQPDDPLYHSVDKTMLQRILINLVSNAVKFTRDGLVEITSVKDSQNNLIISIKDNGIGIAPHHHDAIFEPFVRVESAETSKYSGIGLGLSNVRLMLDKLDGKITLNSSLGSGSTFTMILPN